MVPPGGTREKSPGPGSTSAYMKPKCAPAPRKACGKRPHPAKVPCPKRRGLRGNMVPPSNRARPAVRCRIALPQKRRDCGGPGGHFIFRRSTHPQFPLALFSWTAPAARSLFARKENGGLESTPLGGGLRLRPLGAQNSPGRCAAKQQCGSAAIYERAVRLISRSSAYISSRCRRDRGRCGPL